MFYIIGTKEQTNAFIENNRIPYFDYREDDAYTGEIKLSDEEEAKAILYINLEDDSFTVQTIDNETGGVISETDYPSYEEALEAYENANLIVRYLVTDRADIDWDGEDFETLEEARQAAENWAGDAEIYKYTYDVCGVYAEGDYGEVIDVEKVD